VFPHVLLDDDFFDHTRLFGDDGLLMGLGELDRALLEGRQVALGRRSIDWTALHCDPLVAQVDFLLHRLFGHMAINPYPAAFHLAGLHVDRFFHKRNAHLACLRMTRPTDVLPPIEHRVLKLVPRPLMACLPVTPGLRFNGGPVTAGITRLGR
jgi:hypothetical protein